MFCQEPYSRILSTDDGLPSNTIHTVFTDSKGYVWIGTPNGAVRWDSRNFKTYTIEDGLPNNEVLGFFEDSRGRLWISTFSNELCYLKDKIIYNQKNDKRLEKYKVIPGSNKFEFDSQLIIKHSNSAIFIDLDSLKTKFKIDLNGKVYVEVKRNLFEVDYVDSKLKIWKLNLEKTKNNFSREIVKSKSNKEFLKYLLLSNIINYEESSVLNHENYFFDSIINLNFIKVKSFSNNFRSFFNSNILFLGEDDLKLYSNYNSLYLVNKNESSNFLKLDNKILHLNRRNIVDWNSTIKTKINPDLGLIYNIDKYSKDKYIITTSSNVLIIDNKFNFTNIFPFNKYSAFKNTHYNEKLIQFFVSTTNQLIKIQNNKYKVIYPHKTYCSFLDKSNRLWFSDVNTLRYCDKFQDSVINESEFVLHKSKNVFVKEIKEDIYGNIIFTTNHGIYIYDKKTKQKYDISKTNFLTTNECNKLIIDDNDHSLWIATTLGVNHIRYTYDSKGKLKFELINRFLKDDGLLSDEVNDIMIQGDTAYVATSKGVCMIAEKNIRPDTLSIPIYINEFKVNDSIVPFDSSIRLSPDQKNIELDYSAIYFQRRNRLKIEYKLIRNGDTTSYELTEAKIRLNALSSGDYQLIISAYDMDYPYIKGISKSYSFIIEKPFYEKGWFYMLILLSLGGLGYIYYRRKLDRIQEINVYEKQLSKLKLEALKAEMNPHFIFNCLSAIKDYIMKSDIENSQYYLNKLARLIRLALYNSKDEFVKLSDEINFIEIYLELEQMRFDKKFDFIKELQIENLSHIQIPTMILQPFFENAVRHGKIGQLETQGKLYFRVFEENNHLVFEIKDNGIGIEAALDIKKSSQENHRSMAIEIIQERIAIYNKSYNLNMRYEIVNLEREEYSTQVLIYINLENL